jgi:uncharacterized protein involved in exopolysaccharide biosynthesis
MATNDNSGNAGTHRADVNATPGNATTGDAPPEVAALQADIERTRADLAHTVDQLSAKLDVKTRVRNRVAETKDSATARLRKLQDRATDDDGKPPTATLGIGGGVVAGAAAVLVVVLWRHNNTSRRRKRRWRR